MREEYRREMNCQIVHDSWHSRGFTSAYLLYLEGQLVGYGCVGGAPREPRETVKEFFVFPPARGSALQLFRRLIDASAARAIEAQTNDRLLLLMLLDCATELSSSTILFSDGATSTLTAPAVEFRRLTPPDRESVFEHTREPVGEWGLEHNGQIVATGGMMFHYNPPYADLYMEVHAPYQRRGFGSYLVQELKRVCHESRSIPAARCDQTNVASRRTLERAGMFPCGRIVRGSIDR